MRALARLLALVVAVSVLPLSLQLSAAQVSAAQASSPRTPWTRSWTGFAFDACQAPGQRAMDAWRTASPYRGVGVYIGGRMRACRQPHLNRRWVTAQTRRGWQLLPIWVGPQAPCTSYRHRISSARPGAGYPVARAQGRLAAYGAVRAARRLGIGKGATLWYDLEYFSTGRLRCRHASLTLLSAWTRALRERGYRSGVYSSVSAAIAVLDDAPRRYAAPDSVWFAWANGRADSHIDRRWVRSARWRKFQRVHQYHLDRSETYGGVRLWIDSNWVRIGRRAQPDGSKARCGAQASRNRYPVMRRGDSRGLVEVVSCLLRVGRDRTFDQGLRRAVLRFQLRRGLPATGRVHRRTWTALLSRGDDPVLKRGSRGGDVRRVQRALNAALPGGPAISGHYGPRTVTAVRRYQARIGHSRSGVVSERTWRALRHGRVTPKRPHRR